MYGYHRFCTREGVADAAAGNHALRRKRATHGDDVELATVRPGDYDATGFDDMRDRAGFRAKASFF